LCFLLSRRTFSLWPVAVHLCSACHAWTLTSWFGLPFVCSLFAVGLPSASSLGLSVAWSRPLRRVVLGFFPATTCGSHKRIASASALGHVNLGAVALHLYQSSLLPLPSFLHRCAWRTAVIYSVRWFALSWRFRAFCLARLSSLVSATYYHQDVCMPIFVSSSHRTGLLVRVV